MKKYLIAAFLVLVPSLAFAQTFQVDLHYGSKGDDVTALQEFLTNQGVYSGPITGNFYSLTLAGVRKFQKAEGIVPISGYVGPITRGVINTILGQMAADSEGDATTTQTPVDLSQNQPQTPTPTPTPTPQIVGSAIPPQSSVSSIPDCVPNPQLSLQSFASPLPDGSTNVALIGHYTTGCNFDTNTKWKFTTTNENHAIDNAGTLIDKSPWNLQGSVDGSPIYDRGTFSISSFYHIFPITFVLTVGNTTATTTVEK